MGHGQFHRGSYTQHTHQFSTAAAIEVGLVNRQVCLLHNCENTRSVACTSWAGARCLAEAADKTIVVSNGGRPAPPSRATHKAIPPGDLCRRVRDEMRGRRRRIGAQRRPRISPSAPTTPIAKHRRRDAQLRRDLRQRSTAARQERHRLPLELIRELTPSLVHSTPFCSPRSLPKVSTNSREAQSGHPAVQKALRNPFFDGLGLSRLYVPAHA